MFRSWFKLGFGLTLGIVLAFVAVIISVWALIAIYVYGEQQRVAKAEAEAKSAEMARQQKLDQDIQAINDQWDQQKKQMAEKDPEIFATLSNFYQEVRCTSIKRTSWDQVRGSFELPFATDRTSSITVANALYTDFVTTGLNARCSLFDAIFRTPHMTKDEMWLHLTWTSGDAVPEIVFQPQSAPPPQEDLIPSAQPLPERPQTIIIRQEETPPSPQPPPMTARERLFGSPYQKRYDPLFK